MAENNSSAPLLPCPFCGAAARMKPSTRGDYTSIVCNSPCAGPLAIVVPNDQIEAGIAAWNTRAPQAVAAQAAPAAVAVTEAQIDAILDEPGGMIFYVSDQRHKQHLFARRVLALATPALPDSEDSSAGDLADPVHPDDGPLVHDYGEMPRAALERHTARIAQALEDDAPRKFWRRHAFAPLHAPSCLCCGLPPESVAIQHLELPSVIVCGRCRDAVARAAPP